MSNTSRAWLLQSPDKYFDVVPIFLAALRQTGYFNKFYVASNTSKMHGIDMYDIPKDCIYTVLKRDFGWSNNILRALRYVEEEVFFMGCEDHVLVNFDEDIIERCFQHLATHSDLGCIRLTRKKRIQLKEPDKDFSAMVRPDPYYISLQPTIWKKSYLEKILVPDENAWKFEKAGTRRALAIQKPEAGVVAKTAFNYQNFMKKGGLFRPSYIEFARQHNVPLDSEKFYETWLDEAKVHEAKAYREGKYDYTSIHGM